MGDVGNKLPALALRLLERFRHIIEGSRQLSNLIVTAAVVHADIKVSFGILPRSFDHVPNGLHLPHGGHRGGHKGNHEHHKRGHKEQAHKALPHGIQRGGSGHSKYLAHRLLTHRIHRRHTDNELLLLIQSAQIVPIRSGALPMIFRVISSGMVTTFPERL